MNSRTRRAALVALLGLLVASAGCTTGATTSLLLVNNDDTHHAVTVEITQNGEQVYGEEASVDGESQTELPTFGQSGEYTVAVTVDGKTTERIYEFDSGDETVSIGVDNNGNVTVGG